MADAIALEKRSKVKKGFLSSSVFLIAIFIEGDRPSKTPTSGDNDKVDTLRRVSE